MKRNVLLLLCSLLSTAALAQTGIIRGTIKDGKTKEALIGCTVLVAGSQLGGTTDIDGNFTITNVPASTHKVVVSYISYQTKEIPNVRVESGNSTVIDTELDEGGTALQEVVVRAAKATNTEIAVITEIKQLKSLAVGISAMQIQKSQDRDAASAIRRVPGVSLMDNRFVLIRGLGSRYNSVLLNDVIAPSTEVETRSFSFDLIPSNILDRMIVFKSGTADLPGDFAGGVIKIYTKRKPDRNFLDVAFTTGYRSNTTFQNVQSHNRSGLNALGLWGKDQQISTSFPARSADFNRLNAAQRASYARLLPSSWGLQDMTVAPDIRFALNFGRRFDIGNVAVSNLTALNYSNTNQFTNVDFRLFQNADKANDVYEQYADASYARNTRLGLLHNWSFRFLPSFNLEWKTQFNQLGNTETLVRNGQRVVDGVDVRSYSQRFENRSILTTQVAGEHTVNELTKLNWVAAYGYTGRWEPDWKRARFQRVSGSVSSDGQPQPFQLAVPNDPNPVDVGRFYSRLNENVYSFIGNGERAFGNPADREPNKLKFGIYGERRNRNYAARFYGYQTLGNASTVTQQPINSLFSPQNVTGQPGGLSILDGTRDLDSYQGYTTYGAAYVSGDVNFGPKANLTAGFRGEYYIQDLRSSVNSMEKKLVDNPLFSPLPSLNFTYKLTERQSVRLAYSATVNRAELRELAPFSYFDFALLADIRGNTALKTATIQNVDARYEFYPTPNELISVTGFYKKFVNPIETFLLPTGNGLAYTFTNAQSAQNYGVEVEVRKGFSGSSSVFMQNLQLVANASFINSKISLGQFVQAPDLSGTTQNIDLSGITDTERPLANQSPYLINAGMYYADEKRDFQANILYNVAGQRIFAVGNQQNPTVYEMPRGVLDLNISKKVKQQLELRLGIQDILNRPVRYVQDYNRDGKIGSDLTSQSPNADQIIRSFRRGSYITLTGVYTFGRRTIMP